MAPRSAEKRISFIYFMAAMAFAVVLVQLFLIQVKEHGYYMAEAERQHKRRISIPSRRGEILDSRGEPLAVAGEGLDVYAVPSQISDPQKVAGALSKQFDIPARTLRKRISRKAPFVMIKQKANPLEIQALKEMDLDGIGFMPTTKRYYPHNSLAAQIVGLVGTDSEGLSGIEFLYDDNLKGKSGWLVVQRDARGQAHNVLEYPLSEQKDGNSIRLTIEAEFQEIVEHALTKAVLDNGAKSGCIVALDPSTGKVLALANYPTLNLNSDIGEYSLKDMRNLATNMPYEPGSTMKALTGSALLAGGHISLKDTIFCENGMYRLNRRIIRDVHHFGDLSFHDIIKNSSNVGMAKLIQRIPDNELYRCLRSFGLGNYTSESFRGEDKGILPNPSRWDRATKTSLAIGYGLLATPLQMALAYASLANGGTLYEPILVDDIIDKDGNQIFKSSPRAVRKVLDGKSIEDIRTAMKAVVNDGTAKSAAVDGFEVAGKTGTSMKADPNGGYGGSGYVGSFGGFFPADDPQLVIFIVINEPAYSYRWGGTCAAPAFSQIVRRTLISNSSVIDRKKLGVAEHRFFATYQDTLETNHEQIHPNYIPVTASYPVNVNDSTVTAFSLPDVRGLTIRQAASRLTSMGLRVEIKGSIKVVSQAPVPGTNVAPGDLCRLSGVISHSADEKIASIDQPLALTKESGKEVSQ